MAYKPRTLGIIDASRIGNWHEDKTVALVKSIYHAPCNLSIDNPWENNDCLI